MLEVRRDTRYGFQDILLPYHKYIDDYTCRVLREPQPYIANEISDLAYFQTVTFMTRSGAQRSDLATERRYRRRFAEFVEQNVAQTTLEGTDTDFQNTVQKFGRGLNMWLLMNANRRLSYELTVVVHSRRVM